MRVLVTGAAGFIGSHLAKRLIERGDDVLGYDEVNDYYDPQLKRDRLREVIPRDGFAFVEAKLENRDAMERAFADFKPQRVVNLAAQAGVRYSLQNPRAYVDGNLVGFINVLEACRSGGVEHLVYASSSSVYGANRELPFAVEHSVDHPLSLYAATKKANELMAHTYSHLYSLPTTGLRFFTVYGPWGRPDMSPIIFARKIMAGEPIDVFNHGRHSRDFTYIDDIVEGVVRALDRPPAPSDDVSLLDSPATSTAPYRVYNIGSHRPVELMHFIDLLEAGFGRRSERRLLPMQPGDVADTYADISALVRDTGYQPQTSVETGVANFVDWYRGYYGP
ncbi:NAD-dependent epimerase [Cognatilysobacter lacus]|uniref:NAD-dependent epimerase n=1 Tax=Cognatilysobacter lacus TaxID=1643323 RepID=A0A5D8Z9H2_9GAMM|nr:NAD-dependent epimerase [Lysobacter lacus]TZF91307.1 NAD-dependent epimerase [Lysobacter lacus]